MTYQHHESLMFLMLSSGLLLLLLSLCLVLLATVRYFSLPSDRRRGSGAAIILFAVQVPLWFLLQSFLVPPFPLYRSEICLALIIALLLVSIFFSVRADDAVGRRALGAGISCFAGYVLFATATYWPLLEVRRLLLRTRP